MKKISLQMIFILLALGLKLELQAQDFIHVQFHRIFVELQYNKVTMTNFELDSQGLEKKNDVAYIYTTVKKLKYNRSYFSVEKVDTADLDYDLYKTNLDDTIITIMYAGTYQINKRHQTVWHTYTGGDPETGGFHDSLVHFYDINGRADSDYTYDLRKAFWPDTFVPFVKSKTLYTYDDQGRISCAHYFFYDRRHDRTTLVQSRELYTYDEQGLPIRCIHERPDQNGNWYPAFKNVFAYERIQKRK